MISYYGSKHPGLVLYTALAVISVVTTFFTHSQMALALISIGWSIFVMLRALSLFELRDHNAQRADHHNTSKNSNHQISALAYDLLQRLNGKTNGNQGLRALYCVHERTMMWFMLAIICVGWWIYTQSTSALQLDHLRVMSMLFIAGSIFWGGQSYACSERVANGLMVLFSALMFWITFSAPLTPPSAELSTQTLAMLDHFFSNNLIGVFSFCVLVVYSVMILFAASMRNYRYFLNGIAGLALMLFLFFYSFMHLFTGGDILNLAPLWIAGFGLFSVFWIRAQYHKHKRYVLYYGE